MEKKTSSINAQSGSMPILGKSVIFLGTDISGLSYYGKLVYQPNSGLVGRNKFTYTSLVIPDIPEFLTMKPRPISDMEELRSYPCCALLHITSYTFRTSH